MLCVDSAGVFLLNLKTTLQCLYPQGGNESFKDKNQAKDLKHFQSTRANTSEHRDALKASGMVRQKKRKKALKSPQEEIIRERVGCYSLFGLQIWQLKQK